MGVEGARFPATVCAVVHHHYSVVDGPRIEEDAVVLSIVIEHPESKESGPVFVCRMHNFDDMTVELFPKGQTPHADAEFRAEAIEAARRHLADNSSEFEQLFEELARRTATS